MAGRTSSSRSSRGGEAARSEIRNLVRRMFGNSHELLVLNVLEEEQIDLAELNRLREMLKQKDDER